MRTNNPVYPEPTFLRTPGHRLDEHSRWYVRRENGELIRLGPETAQELELKYQLDDPQPGWPQEIKPDEIVEYDDLTGEVREFLMDAVQFIGGALLWTLVILALLRLLALVVV